MMNVIIRPAKDEDAHQLQPLLKQLGYPQKADNMSTTLQRYLSTKDQGVFVAEQNKKIVGVIAFSIRDLFIGSIQHIRIEALIVDENNRKKGIGKKLINALEDYAKKNNIRVIELTSGKHRSTNGTHIFYQNLGYNNEENPKVYLRKKL